MTVPSARALSALVFALLCADASWAIVLGRGGVGRLTPIQQLAAPAPAFGRLLSACGAGLALVACGAQYAHAGECTDESNPSYTVRKCVNVGVQPDGRLPKCEANSNCISTSNVASPQHFMPPLSFRSPANGDLTSGASDREVRTAWNLLKDTVRNTPGLTVLNVDDDALYLRAEAAASVPPTSMDDVEFLLRPADGAVFFHSETRDTVFVYPVQRPVGCGDCHRKRLDALFARLGWSDLSSQFETFDEEAALLEEEIAATGRSDAGFTFGRFVPLK